MYGLASPVVVYMRPRVLFTFFVFACAELCPTHIVLCFCFVCLRHVSCVPYFASFSGLSIIDCLFGFL